MSIRLRTVVLSAALAATATGPVYLSTSMVTAPPAQAFGWKDIKKGAKKVGGAVKKGAKKVGGAVKKGAKKAANGALAVTAEVVKVPTVGGATLIAKGLGTYDEDFRRRADKLRAGIDKAFTVDRIGNAVGRGAKKVGKVIIGRNKIGESLPRPDKSKAENALADYMNRRGVSSRQAASRRTMKPGLVKHGRYLDERTRVQQRNARKVRGSRLKDIQASVRRPEAAGQKIGNKQRPIIGRDKSVFGRPVFAKKRKVRKVRNIRLKDIRRSKKHSKRRQIGRDKSVFGRPVFANRRKMNKRQRLGGRALNGNRKLMKNGAKHRFGNRKKMRRMSSNNRGGGRSRRR